MRRFTIGLVAALVTASAVATVGGAPSPVAAATPSSGFTDQFVASFSRPTAVEWLPGDRIVVLEQGGRVRIGRPGTAFTTALDLGVCSGGERGLLGFTPDPGFLGNGYVYVYFTRDAPTAPGGCVNRVSRFTMTGDVIDPASQVVLIDNISSVNGNHNGGDLDIGSDGFLYVSIGDAGRDPRGDSGSAGGNDAAQDRSLLNGKILRITLDGQPAPGNPLTGPGTARCAFRGSTPATPTTECQELFAWGLRNPFRIAFDRNDGAGRFFINDVGQGTFEEVDQGAIGRNYGWPIREGSCPQGDTPPCPGPPAGLTDPITSYGRSLGTYVTAGAFVPNGLWPAAYDGGYLFADGGSGRIWLRKANGSVDYGTPFATDAYGISDMTFGFTADGRLALYYVSIGSGLRMITSTAPLASTAASGLKMVPITPERAYDTGQAIGTAAGAVVNGTTRVVDLDAPPNAKAALVNLTYADTAGPGYLRVWGTRAARPSTSSINTERAGINVANAAVVPLDANGRFVVESATTGRVVVDVMAWLVTTGGASDDGRFVPLGPSRLADTREPAGVALDSGSPNPWTRATNRIDLEVAGNVGVPDDGTAAAAVVSIVAISDGRPGHVGAYPLGGTYGGTSNVNVQPGDRRANLVLVPLGPAGGISLKTLNVADVVVDVLGYVTSATAPSASAGLYTSVAGTRIVDTRIPLGFARLAALATATVTVPGGATRAAVVQNVTVTNTSGPGWVAAHATPTPDGTSTLNATGTSQTRAALAFSPLATGGDERFTALVPTDLVVDVVGFFSK